MKLLLLLHLSCPGRLEFFLLAFDRELSRFNISVLLGRSVGELVDVGLQFPHPLLQFFLFFEVAAGFTLLLREDFVPRQLEGLVLLEQDLLVLHHRLVIIQQLPVIIHELLDLLILVVDLRLHLVLLLVGLGQLGLRSLELIADTLHLVHFRRDLAFVLLRQLTAVGLLLQQSGVGLV